MPKAKVSTAPRPVKFRTQIGVVERLKLHIIVVPALIVKRLGGKFSLRIVIEVDGKLKFQGGLVALGGGKGYVTLSKARLKVLGKAAGDAVGVVFTADRSKFGMEYPDELRVLLAQNGEGKRKFIALPAGKQRYIVYYVGLVKNPHLRIERAIFLIENLKRSPSANPRFQEILGKSKRI